MPKNIECINLKMNSSLRKGLIVDIHKLKKN